MLEKWHTADCLEHPKYRPEEKPQEPTKKTSLTVEITAEQLLCSACRVLTRYGYDFGENPALDQFWDYHQKIDAKNQKK